MTSDRESISAAYDALEAAFETVATLSYDVLDVAESLGCFDRLEDLRRRVPAADHQLLAHLQSRTTAGEVGAKNWADVLAIRLRISAKEAKRRVQETQDLGPRTALTGEPLAPRLPATSSAQARGDTSCEHVAITRKCLADVPVFVDATTRVQIDQDLARIATGNTPETLRQAADRLLFLLNQDGDAPNDEHRARRRGVFLGRQDADGMTPIRGWLDPELRASVDAVSPNSPRRARATRTTRLRVSTAKPTPMPCNATPARWASATMTH
jgi:hypothetical protein